MSNEVVEMLVKQYRELKSHAERKHKYEQERIDQDFKNTTRKAGEFLTAAQALCTHEYQVTEDPNGYPIKVCKHCLFWDDSDE